MKEFKTYHPIVNFIYFLFVIGFSCFFMHPLCLGISLVCSFTYSVMLKGKKAIKTNLIYMLPVIIITSLINPAFNHEGMTILGYLPDGNPLTLESVVYGICAAIMIANVICYFSCYNEIMTSDKFIYLFGKVIPSLSLIISMTLRFVPKFSQHLKTVRNAQKCMGRDLSEGNIIKRIKNGLKILSIMTTWSLENAIETSDSMKARGYGIPGRSAYSIFSFDKRDAMALLCILIFAIYTLSGYLAGAMSFSFFPILKMSDISVFEISVYLSYFMLCITPVIIEIWEVRRWNVSKSKI